MRLTLSARLLLAPRPPASQPPPQLQAGNEPFRPPSPLARLSPGRRRPRTSPARRRGEAATGTPKRQLYSRSFQAVLVATAAAIAAAPSRPRPSPAARGPSPPVPGSGFRGSCGSFASGETSAAAPRPPFRRAGAALRGGGGGDQLGGQPGNPSSASGRPLEAPPRKGPGASQDDPSRRAASTGRRLPSVAAAASAAETRAEPTSSRDAAAWPGLRVAMAAPALGWRGNSGEPRAGEPRLKTHLAESRRFGGERLQAPSAHPAPRLAAAWQPAPRQRTAPECPLPGRATWLSLWLVGSPIDARAAFPGHVDQSLRD